MESIAVSPIHGGLRLDGVPDAVKAIELQHPSARRFADLSLHVEDLELAQHALAAMDSAPAKTRAALWRAAVLSFLKCFGGSKARSQLDAKKIPKDPVLDPLQCRIAINTQDIQVIKNPITGRHDIFGEGINLAARLEPEVEPGYVYSVTRITTGDVSSHKLHEVSLKKPPVAKLRPFVVVRRGQPDPRSKIPKKEPVPETTSARAILMMDPVWPTSADPLADDDAKAALQAFVGKLLRGPMPLRVLAAHAEVDDVLNLVPGSTRSYLPALAIEAGYMIEMTKEAVIIKE